MRETPSMQDLSKYDEPGESDEYAPATSGSVDSTLSAICSIPELDNLSNYIDALELHREIKVCLHQRVNLLVSALSKQFAAPPVPVTTPGKRKYRLEDCEPRWVVTSEGRVGIAFSCPEACHDDCYHAIYFSISARTSMVRDSGSERTYEALSPVSSSFDRFTLVEPFESSCGCRVRLRNGKFEFLDEVLEDASSKRVESDAAVLASETKIAKSDAPDLASEPSDPVVEAGAARAARIADAERIASTAERIFIAKVGNPSFDIGLYPWRSSELRDDSVRDARKIIEDAEKAAEERASHRSRAGERRPL